MRPVKLTYAPRARTDLDEIHSWLSERSLVAASSVLRAIRGTAELIGEYPQIGRATDIEGVKVLPVIRYPYLVYYTVEAGEVVIVHVRHGARSLPRGGDI